MESGDITNDQISATSHYSDLYATKGRLHQLGCWEASHVRDVEWIQVDLIDLHTITGLITQGRGTKTYWVKTYLVSYESRFHDGVWQIYRNLDGQEKVIVAEIV